MADEIIKEILIYNINQKDKIIGKLKNISKNEALSKIRPNIKKMTQNNEFVSIKANEEIDTIDKDVEDDFNLEDILINQNGVFKIYISGSNKNELNNINNNVHIQNQNEPVHINNNNFNLNNNFNDNMNNFELNRINQIPNQNEFINNFNNINPNFNNMNNINNNINCINDNNMNNINNMNNNINGMMNFNMNMNNNGINNMFNMMNLNNNNIGMNGMMFFNNQNVGNINNNNQELNNNINHQIKIYHVTFKVSNGLIYNMRVIYNEKIKDILKSFYFKTVINKFDNENNLQYFYNKININIEDNNKAEYFFKGDRNPIIFVNDNNYLIKKNSATFVDKYGKHYIIFNTIIITFDTLLNEYLSEIDHFGLNINEIQFIYNNSMLNYNQIFNEFNNNITIYVNDINNLIKIIKIIFQDNHGDKIEIIANKKKTIKELIKRYLEKVDHEELTENERKDEIQFLYNQKKLDYNDNTIIEDYFKSNINPVIQVNDFDGMLLVKPIEYYNITFETLQGYTVALSSLLHFSIHRIISNYLTYIDHSELIININNNIRFLYNGQILEEKYTARKCFKNNFSPKIIVMDKNYLLNNASKYNEAKPGQKINVILKTTYGKRYCLLINYETTIDKMLMKYIMCFFPEYTHTNRIKFIFNSNQLKLGDQTPVGKYFIYFRNPTILVLKT